MKKNETAFNGRGTPCFKKILRIMKLTSILLFVMFFQVSAGVFSQNSSQLTLNLKDVSVMDVLKQIEEESKFTFLFNSNQIDIDRQVTIECNSSSVENVLKTLFEGTDVTYRTFNNNYVLYAGQEERVIPAGQDLDVNGTVTDDTGFPLPGVAVIIKGTTLGITTDTDGNYSLKGVPADATLVFSFIGMKTLEIPVNGNSTIDATLSADAIGIEEVVAVGYGVQKKVNLTGSVVQIDTEDLQSSAVTNTSSALQGKGAGIMVSQNSGMAGEDNSSIKIRGVGTLNAGQSPLVLVDGIQMDMNNVDPMDIESVSVLKDAASAAIYGSRAANGVILITTKGGKRGQETSVSYNTYYGVQQITQMPDLLNAYDNAILYNEALANDGLPIYFDDEQLLGLQNAIKVNDVNFPNNLSEAELADFNNNGFYQDVDYAAMNYRKAVLQKHYLSVEGGGENSNGRIGIGYMNQEGIRYGNESESYNIKLNYDVSLLDDKLKIYSNLYYFRKEYDKGASGGAGNWYVTPWEGYYFPNGLYSGEADFQALSLGAHDINTKNEVVGLIGARITPVKNLDVVVEYSQLRYNGKNDEFSVKRQTYNSWMDIIGEERSELSLDAPEFTRQTGTATATYKANISTKSKLTLLGGTSFEDGLWESFGASRQDMLNNFQPELNLGSAATMTNWSGASDYSLLSVFGRANYNYDNRYLFEVNVRRDGSSRFDSDHQWGTFPSASFGWRVSEESFMQDASSVDNLKLRLSYGQLGNQNIDNYAARDRLSASGAYPVNNSLETTVGMGSLANKEISWETTTMANIGVDLTLFEQLSLSFDYYNKVSSDVLYRIAIPQTVGVGSGPYRNIAEVQNLGWDLALAWDKKVSQDLTLGANLNLSHYKNEITKLNNSDAPVFRNYTNVWQEGQPVNAFYGYEHGGIASQEQIDGGLIPDQGFDISAGDLWYKDIAGDDNKITDEDRGIIGIPHPDLIFSLNLSAKWKGLDVSMLFEGNYGMESLLYSAMYRTEYKTSSVNKPTELLDRWTVDNQGGSFPKLSALEDKLRVSDFYMEDASYLRGKDLTIGYTIPKGLLSRIGLKHVRIYSNFRNLFVLTNFRGLDPETANSGDTSRAGIVPPSKVYTLGLQVKL